MKTKLTIALAVVLSAAIFTSCSIEKRHYMNGYHVTWNHASAKSKTAESQPKDQEIAQVSATSFTEQSPVVAETPVTVAEAPSLVTPIVQENVSTTEQVAASAVTKDAVKNTTVSEKATNVPVIKNTIKKAAKSGGDVPKGLLIVLCFLLPWLAVGLATDWDVKTIIFNLLWSLTCIGGIIHALIVVNRNT